MPKNYNAIVSQRIELAPGLIKLRVVPQGWELPDFEPGQYVQLGLPWSAPRHPLADPENITGKNPERFIPRAFSIASSSVAKEYIEFYIGLVRSGVLSSRLFNLKLGDRLWMSQTPLGMFTLAEVPDNYNIILIATGTGVAPYMSMIRTELSRGFDRRFVIVHGACHLSDLGYHSELTIMDSLCTTFNYLPLISRPGEEPVVWKGLTGHVQDLWIGAEIDRTLGYHPAPDNSHIFLCGNPDMIDDMLILLQNDGFREHTERTEGQVHTEKYF